MLEQQGSIDSSIDQVAAFDIKKHLHIDMLEFSNEEDFNGLIKTLFSGKTHIRQTFYVRPNTCVEGIFLVNMRINSQLNSTLHDSNNKTNRKPDCASQKQLY